MKNQRLNKTIKLFSLTAIASLMLMSKCGKDKPEIDDETQTIEDNIVSEQEFMRIIPTTNDKAIKQKGIGSSGKMLSGSITTTFQGRNSLQSASPTFGWGVINNSNFNNYIDSASGTYQNQIDSIKIAMEFSPNVNAPDGSKKSGSIITLMTRKQGKPFYLFGKKDAEFVTILKDFNVDGILYNGNIEVERKSNTEMKIKVVNGRCTKASWPGSIEFSNESERKIKWMKGPNHPSTSDAADEYEIEEDNSGGRGCKGKSRNGLGYTMKITKPLKYRTDAKYGIIDGEVELTPEGKKTRVINYSQISKGIVTFTTDGNTFTIVLK
jgi:hypothetical protein